MKNESGLTFSAPRRGFALRRDGFFRLPGIGRQRLRCLRTSFQLRSTHRATRTDQRAGHRRCGGSSPVSTIEDRFVSPDRGSALTDMNIAVPDAPTKTKIGEEIPVTYVPFRNAHFLSAAVSWAEVLGAGAIFIGAVEQDSSGYPDCRPAYYAAFQKVIETGTKEGNIQIHTPLIHMKKSEIVRLGVELHAPLHLTWSCYSGEDRACGVCDSCVLRLRAFAEAGVADPIPYRAISSS